MPLLKAIPLPKDKGLFSRIPYMYAAELAFMPRISFSVIYPPPKASKKTLNP